MIKIGSICKCRNGKLAVVTKIITSKKYDYPQIIKYRGINFDGNSWESVKPELVADTIEDYLDDFSDRTEEAVYHKYVASEDPDY